MSERWKFQIKRGLLWGLTISILMTLLECWADNSFSAFSSSKFVVKVAVFCGLGIFLVGYFSWKEHLKLGKK